VESVDTTISCRFIAPTSSFRVVIALLLTLGGPPVATSQQLPTLPRWTVALPAAPAPATAPVAAGDLIVVPLQSGALSAYQIEDGRSIWSIELLPAWPMTADDERVYVVSGDALYAIDLGNGSTAWRTTGVTPTAPPVVRSGWLVLATKEGVIALRAADGAELWRRDVGTIPFRPAIDGDFLYLSILDGRVAALDLPTGTERWTRRLEGHPFEPLAIGGRVYVGAADKYFYALDASSGAVDWRMRVGAEPRGRPTADADHVYAVSLDNVLRAFDRGHGALEWNEGLPFRPAAGPLVLGPAVTVPGGARAMPAFGTADGRQVGTIQFEATLAALPAVARLENGTAALAVVTGDLASQWKLSLLDPMPALPVLPVAPLSAVPGDVIPLGWPEP
jgi:outer membrane protein assembly factor BamB